MRVLLDENMPRQLTQLFTPNIEAVTVGQHGWKGKGMDPALGSGWMKLKDSDEVRGLIKFHLGDRSIFKAHRAG